MAAVDRCVSQVLRSVDELRAQGQEVLCLVGSDHGQETVRRIIPLDEELVASGLKQSLDSDDVLIAPQGTGALFYLRKDVLERRDAIADYLAGQDWAGQVLYGQALAQAGLPGDYGLSLALSMAKSTEPNEFGVPGLSDYGAVQGKTCAKGIGQHGGLGIYEHSPFLIAWGRAFQEARWMPGPAARSI